MTAVIDQETWPTLADIARTHQIPLYTVRQRFKDRKADYGIEAHRQGRRSPYRVNPDHVGALLHSGRLPPWKTLKNLQDEYTFMRWALKDHERALHRLSQAYKRSPRTIANALNHTLTRQGAQ